MEMKEYTVSFSLLIYEKQMEKAVPSFSVCFIQTGSWSFLNKLQFLEDCMKGAPTLIKPSDLKMHENTADNNTTLP